jgi:hypothetical protein
MLTIFLYSINVLGVLSHRGALANVTDAGQDAVDAAASGAEEGFRAGTHEGP